VSPIAANKCDVCEREMADNNDDDDDDERDASESKLNRIKK
jgi:hypothetical protein